MIKFNTLRHYLLSVGIATFIGTGTTKAQANTPIIPDDVYSNLPFQMTKVQQPVFPAYSRSITEFGATADGTTLNTEAFAQTIEAVSRQGGGTVIVPAGLWLTGPIVLKAISTCTWKKMLWCSLQPTTHNIPLSRLHSKDWRHDGANRPYLPTVLKT